MARIGANYSLQSSKKTARGNGDPVMRRPFPEHVCRVAPTNIRRVRNKLKGADAWTIYNMNEFNVLHKKNIAHY
jgi:hypothetical protein